MTFKRNTESSGMQLCKGDLKWEINIIICGFLVCHSDRKQGFALCVLNTGFSQSKSLTYKSDGGIVYGGLIVLFCFFFFNFNRIRALVSNIQKCQDDLLLETSS